MALCFHQFFEGVGLGCTIQEARLDLGHWNVVVFVLVFSSTVSIGVMIGYLMNKYPSTDDATETTILLFVKGAFNSIAAGVLIYVSMVEMIAEDYQSMVTVGKPVLKVRVPSTTHVVVHEGDCNAFAFPCLLPPPFFLPAENVRGIDDGHALHGYFSLLGVICGAASPAYHHHHHHAFLMVVATNNKQHQMTINFGSFLSNF